MTQPVNKIQCPITFMYNGGELTFLDVFKNNIVESGTIKLGSPFVVNVKDTDDTAFFDAVALLNVFCGADVLIPNQYLDTFLDMQTTVLASASSKDNTHHIFEELTLEQQAKCEMGSEIMETVPGPTPEDPPVEVPTGQHYVKLKYATSFDIHISMGGTKLMKLTGSTFQESFVTYAVTGVSKNPSSGSMLTTMAYIGSLANSIIHSISFPFTGVVRTTS